MVQSAAQPPLLTELTEAEFLRFRDFFYRKTGIHFEQSKRYFVDKRLLQRIAATGHRGFRDYFTFLRFQASGEELQEVINLLTVNETYFMREEYQLQCMVKSILGEIVRNKGRHELIRIWSIPSSTGEEPYSIALYLLEYWPMIDQVDVEILASDIDTQVLQQARRGIFTQRSVQNMPPRMLEKYFTRLPGGRFQLDQEVRESVAFSRVNLTNPAETGLYRNVDLVLCRNLLIYFDDVSRRQAADAIYEALNPDGFVMLGHSESMSRISPLFAVRKFDDAIVYQKPAPRGS